MGWFSRRSSKKSSEVEEQRPVASEDAEVAAQTAEAAAVVARWDKAIAKIQARFDEVLQQALTESEPLIAATQTDLGPVTRVWNGVEAKKHKHCDKISDRWDRICDDLAELDELPDELIDREGDKRDRANCEIDVRYHRAYRDVMARAAEQMQQWAATSGDANAQAIFAGSGALCLAQRAAFDSWATMKRAETEMNSYRNKRDVPMTLLEEFSDAARAYWETLLTVEADQVPEIRQHVPMKLAGYTKTIEKTLRQYWQWRERHH